MFAETGRRKITRIAVLTVAIASISIIWPATPAESAARQRVSRIKFMTGQTSARVKGRLRGQNDVAHYVMRVRAGQRMHIKVESRQLGNPQIDVIFPSDKRMDRDMQGTQFDAELTEAGDYRIRVYEGRKADPSAGTFYLKIDVN